MPSSPIIIYNLFPRLAGPFPRWRIHLERASAMKFTWLFINPVQYSGFSGSVYAIKDYYQIDPRYTDPESGKSGDEQFQAVLKETHGLGLKVMMDLVINHTAFDSVLVKSHPQWYRRDEKGEVMHPGAPDTGEVWKDLAIIDNEGSQDRERLWKYWEEWVAHQLSLGIDGFRCDAAYQVPAPLWRRLIQSARKVKPDVKFFAETLGCGFDCVIDMAKAGFDYNFNSSKWWNFIEPWALEQYEENRLNGCPSVSFPDSHDTSRLAADLQLSLPAIKMRYQFAALFSTGVMMTSGFEFCFQKKLDVVKTTPDDWEEPQCNLTEFVREVNLLKSRYPVFCEESRIDVVSSPNPRVFVMKKTSGDQRQLALLIFNLDSSDTQRMRYPSLRDWLDKPDRISDVSVEGALGEVPDDFEVNLKPGQVKVLLGEKHG